MFPPLQVVGRLAPVLFIILNLVVGVGALLLGNWLLIFWVGTWLSKLVGASLFRFGRRLCMLGSEKMKRHLKK